MELTFHLRPRRLRRLLRARDPVVRRQLGWTARHTVAVWLAEIAEFVFRCRFARRPRPLGERLARDGGGGPARGVPVSLEGRAVEA